VRIRRELRGVQYQLQRDIDRLAGVIKAVNIGFVPLLVGAAAVVVLVRRRGREREWRKAA
jgi:hypothetical protein